ncbi:MAG: PD-(D/E)XK nuclease family protein [Candidatus Yanofskybacteria bacterium]|nr:PD-(D/E)XK nuclease family protein [Candidatus Yanofskybacteria bacterium]
MKQVSFSQLMTYVRCPEHWLFRYKLGIRRQPRKVFKHGFALHETLQYHFEQKKEDGRGLKLAEAQEFFVHSFGNALEDYKQELAEARPYLTREYLSKEKHVRIEDMIDTGLKGLETYFQHLNPFIHPDLIEEPFTFQVSPNLEVVGRIDMTDTGGVIHELKTTRVSPNKQDIRSDAQISIYQVGYKSITGKAPRGISKDYIVLSKNNSRIVRFKVVRPFLDKKTVARNITAIMEAARGNIFYCMHPAESWICSKEWCSYYTLHQELKKLGLHAFLEKYSIPLALP